MAAMVAFVGERTRELRLHMMNGGYHEIELMLI